jgi:type I restriction enzyme S subunit
MQSEWSRATFAELIERGVLEIGDGYRAKNDELGGQGLIFLRAGHVTDTHIDFANVERFTILGAEKFGAKVACPGDVVVTTKGNSTGRVAFVTDAMPSFVYSPHLSYWRSKRETVLHQGFLRAWSRGDEFAVQLAAMSRSTDMAPYLSLSDQRRLHITLPTIADQRRIGELGDAIDKRLDNLRETNTTIEAVAQALFKSWFVDFDPVRVKIEGRAPEGMDEATAALFPDEFEESELGMVPKGWRVNSVYDAAQIIYGAPFASKQFNSTNIGKPLIRIRDLRDESPSVFTQEVHPKGYLVQPGDIVVGMDGEFRSYLWGGEEAWLNQRVCVFAPKPGFPAAYLHRSIMPLLAAVEASETATTVIHLGKNDIDRFKILIPDEIILAAFGLMADRLYQRIVNAKQSIKTLATLRDTLLPRLISGQLRLPEAEAQIEAIAA